MTATATESQRPEAEQYLLHANYELFVFGVVLITMVNDLLVILNFDVEITTVADAMNAILTAFLLFDATMRLFWRGFGVRWLVRGGGWIVFLGSVPLPFFGIARLLRTLMMLRNFRRADLLEAGDSIRVRRAQTTLLGVLLLSIIGFELAGIAILFAEESHPDANIQNASDALWWSYVTIATVGYGDRYPVTTGGRVIGAVVITLGVALFSTITGFLSDWFRRPRAPLPAPHHPLLTADVTAADVTAADVNTLVGDMRQMLEDKADADRAALDELRARLDEIERRLGQLK